MVRKNEYVVFGLNGTGRNLAFMLAAQNQGTLILLDDEKATEAHFDQGYAPIDIGSLKTEAVREAILDTLPRASIKVFNNLEQTLEILENKIGNVVFFCCKPVSNKTRLHIVKVLNNAAQHIHFCGYDASGNYDIFSYGNDSAGTDALNKLDSQKENVELAGAAAACMFTQQMLRSQQVTW